VRKTYQVGGRAFEMRTFNERDWIAVRGKLTLLPTAEPSGQVSDRQAVIGIDGAAQMLARCSIKPKLLVNYPDTDPGDGFLALDDLTDAEFMELVKLLSNDSGFGVEDAAEIRPSVATSEGS